jgi:hypothetical protein
MKNTGIKTFITIWFGQFVSQTGTALTRFALLIWAYEQTGSAMSLSGYLIPAVRHVEDDLPDHDRAVLPVTAVQPT